MKDGDLLFMDNDFVAGIKGTKQTIIISGFAVVLEYISSQGISVSESETTLLSSRGLVVVYSYDLEWTLRTRRTFNVTG